eukprot:1156723-Pelagomonas_calceolata.AAC.11
MAGAQCRPARQQATSPGRVRAAKAGATGCSHAVLLLLLEAGSVGGGGVSVVEGARSMPVRLEGRVWGLAAVRRKSRRGFQLVWEAGGPGKARHKGRRKGLLWRHRVIGD